MVAGGGVKIWSKKKKSDDMSKVGELPIVLGELDFDSLLNHPMMRGLL